MLCLWGRWACEVGTEWVAMSLRGRSLLLWHLNKEGGLMCFSSWSCDQDTSHRSWPAVTWNLWGGRESGMKRRMTFRVWVCSPVSCQVILRIVGAMSGAYLFALQESRGKSWAGCYSTYFTLAHSSSEMYSSAGSCLSFEEKQLKIKIPNMTGKCVA